MVDSSSLRAVNRARVLDTLMSADNALRPELARRLGLSPMSVTRIVRELIGVGLAREDAVTRRADLGRPARTIAINPSAAYVLGFEMHAYRQSVAIMDLSAQVVRRVVFTLTDPTNGPRALAEMVRQAQTGIRNAKIQPLRVMGAVAGITGVVDRERGIAVESPYLGWSSLDVGHTLQELLGIPVMVDRITSLLLGADARKMLNLRDAILFNIGFAMNAGLLVNGSIAHGEGMRAGQIGHLPTDDETRRCPQCGRGCLNVAASGWSALADMGLLEEFVLSAQEFQRHLPQMKRLLQLASDGHADACASLRKAGRTLGRTIKVLRITLDPRRVLLAGPVGTAAAYVEGVREGIGPEASSLVAPCSFNDEDAAALMALEEFVRTPRIDFERLRKAGRLR